MAQLIKIEESKLKEVFTNEINPLLGRLAKDLDVTNGPQVIVFAGYGKAISDAVNFTKFMNANSHPSEAFHLSVDGEDQAIVVANKSDQIKISFKKVNDQIECLIEA